MFNQRQDIATKAFLTGQGIEGFVLEFYKAIVLPTEKEIEDLI